MNTPVKLNCLLVLFMSVWGCNSNGSAEGPAPVQLEALSLGEVYNLHSLGPVLVAGQPAEADFALLSERGVTTVITLRTDGEVTEFDEARAVEEAGMKFVSIPFRGPEALTDEVFGAVRDALNGADGSVLLHCGSASRVGAVVLPWRVLDHGLPLEEALEEARAIGPRTAPYEERALDYVARMQATE
jgi:uncharacterized protein (TIGR01244 family)